MKGRQLTTGRYSSHDELVENVLFFYYRTAMNQSQVARMARVSQSKVANILKQNSQQYNSLIGEYRNEICLQQVTGN